jgi:hypothetical protein
LTNGVKFIAFAYLKHRRIRKIETDFNCCNPFQFLMYSYWQLSGQNSEEQTWRKLIMKSAICMLVITLILGAGSFAQAATFSGPGTPPADPPVAAL